MIMNEMVARSIALGLIFGIFCFMVYVDRKQTERLENLIEENDIEFEIVKEEEL